MAIKYEKIRAVMAIVKDKINLPLNNSFILILKIQLSPKSCLIAISETHFPNRYKNGLSNPSLIFSASISSKVIWEPCVFLNAR